MPFRLIRTSQRGRGRGRGQALVEVALVAPVFILLLLMAVDFGRLFLGWVTLNNMSRVAANYAAMHADAWGASPDTDDQAEYQTVVIANSTGINCVRRGSSPPPTTDQPVPAPQFGATKQPGDLVRVEISCFFRVLTPLIDQVTGQWIRLGAGSTFPITSGCIGTCSGGAPPPPPPPATSNCRTVPNMTGVSLAGARTAWANAGFAAAQFSPATGDNTRTVASQTVTEPANTENCTGSQRYFGSAVTVTLAPLVTPKPTPTCLYVPNMKGITVADARSTWATTGFTGTFIPSAADTQVVIGQVTTPGSNPGDCLEPDASVSVTYGPPAVPAAPPPCKVPSFVNTSSMGAPATWTTAGFSSTITFKKQNQLPYTILSQSLVGGTYVNCAAAITLSPDAR